MGFRIPDSLFLAYFPCVIAWSPTPARFLSLIDPLIPLGFMTNCLKGNFFYYYNFHHFILHIYIVYYVFKHF